MHQLLFFSFGSNFKFSSHMRDRPTQQPTLHKSHLFPPTSDHDLIAVAHYLPAASLDALSASCKGQHRTCSALVPGLKLDLFPHQQQASK